MSFDERLASFASPHLTELRPAQQRALEAFDALRATNTDIGIELPTGSGKTLIALLIADQALDEGRSVAYLTGTKQLAEQAVDQAKLLGLDVELFFAGNYRAKSLLAYNNAESVGIMNYWAYFNTNPRVEPADLVIFDDAHLAEQALAGLFTVRIPRSPGGGTQLFQEIADLVIQQAPDSYPSLQALRDGTAPWSTPPELISFMDWAAVAGSVEDAIESSAYLRTSDLGFPWRAVRNQLKRCGVLFGPSALEIRPYHIPSQTVPGYSRSKQRVYLSATLGQSGDIQRRLGVKEVVAAATAGDAALAELGLRNFLINPTLDAALSEPSWAFAMQQVAKAAADASGGRVAWLCASNAEADLVQGRLEAESFAVVRLKGGEDPALDRWRTTANSHLVTAGRFDGLDFPDDICRLVIIPSVPAASTEFERFVVAYLGDASYMRYRIGQRVTQALGRANRTPGDSALYLGLDPAFGPTLADAAVQEALGRDVRATVNEALQYHGGSWSAVSRAAASFWSTHREPRQAILQEPVAAGRVRPGRTSRAAARGDSAGPEIDAVTRLWLGDNAGAAETAEKAAQVLHSSDELEHAAFWNYVQAHSLFGGGRPADIALAKAALDRAVESAPQTAWFVRLRRTIDALAGTAVTGDAHDGLFLAWDEWIREAGPRVQRRIATGRSMLEGTHDQQSEALTILARLCGATGDRPGGQSATDARWAWATPRKGQRRLWEVKTGEPDRIPRDDINQVLGQVQVEQNMHPLSRVVGCLLTSLDDIEKDAAQAARDKVVLVRLPAAVTLYDLMADRFSSYFTKSGSGSAVERGAARHDVEPRLPAGDWVTQLLTPRGAAFVERADVERLFVI